MTTFEICALIWWAVGFISCLYWWSKRIQVDGGDLFAAAVFGVFGPIAFLICWLVSRSLK